MEEQQKPNEQQLASNEPEQKEPHFYDIIGDPEKSPRATIFCLLSESKMLILAIFFSISLLLNIIYTIFTEISTYELIEQLRLSTYINVSFLTDNYKTVDLLVRIFSFAPLIPLILCSLGLWFMYLGSQKEKTPTIVTGSRLIFTMFVIYLSVPVALFLVGFFCGLFATEVPTENTSLNSAYSTTQPNVAAIVFLFLIIIVILAFFIIYMVQFAQIMWRTKITLYKNKNYINVTEFIIFANRFIAIYYILSVVLSILTPPINFFTWIMNPIMYAVNAIILILSSSILNDYKLAEGSVTKEQLLLLRMDK